MESMYFSYPPFTYTPLKQVIRVFCTCYLQTGGGSGEEALKEVLSSSSSLNSGQYKRSLRLLAEALEAAEREEEVNVKGGSSSGGGNSGGGKGGVVVVYSLIDDCFDVIPMVMMGVLPQGGGGGGRVKGRDKGGPRGR